MVREAIKFILSIRELWFFWTNLVLHHFCIYTSVCVNHDNPVWLPSFHNPIITYQHKVYDVLWKVLTFMETHSHLCDENLFVQSINSEYWTISLTIQHSINTTIYKTIRLVTRIKYFYTSNTNTVLSGHFLEKKDSGYFYRNS